MAMSNDPRDLPERDPQLARLMAAAGDEQPPAALDAAILAAARREVSARPQTAGGGGTAAPAVRSKRNWYVPVSIAAVLVLSVSLVTLVYEEQGDELAQPKAQAPAPVETRSQAETPQSPSAPAAAPAPAADPALPAMADAVPAQPRVPEQKRAEAQNDRVLNEAARSKTEAQVEPPRRDAAKLAPPEPALETRPSAATAAEPGAAVGGAMPGAAPAAAPPAPAPVTPMLAKERQPDPFPSSRDREAPAAAARRSAESANADQRDLRTFRNEPPPAAVAAAPAPPPATAAAPTAPSIPGDVRPRMSSTEAEGRISAAPASPAAVMAKPAAKRAEVQATPRPVWLIGLENQPPEKWLERLAEFKRDGRAGDADTLMMEFRRRFPEHPASAR